MSLHDYSQIQIVDAVTGQEEEEVSRLNWFGLVSLIKCICCAINSFKLKGGGRGGASQEEVYLPE